ncbi:hypothetical protein HZA55_07205 [Candidatus Poribacteria bacterium]|nr:hypothetical protein [Candidatus Poribacteria bacterium]
MTTLLLYDYTQAIQVCQIQNQANGDTFILFDKKISGCCIINFFLFCFINNVFANEFMFDIYGLSHHYKTKSYINKYNNKKNFNELNPGLGLRHVFLDEKKYAMSALIGFYKDSMENNANYFGFSYKYKITEDFYAGVDLGFFETKSYDEHVFPLPTLTYHAENFAVNLIWIPSNTTPALGLSLTIPIRIYEKI